MLIVLRFVAGREAMAQVGIGMGQLALLFVLWSGNH